MASPRSWLSFHVSSFIVTILIFCLSHCALCLDGQTVVDSPLLTEKLGINRTIKVDINGNGEFKSIQAAIDSIPEGNSKWVIVHVRKGIYRYKYIIYNNLTITS